MTYKLMLVPCHLITTQGNMTMNRIQAAIQGAVGPSKTLLSRRWGQGGVATIAANGAKAAATTTTTRMSHPHYLQGARFSCNNSAASKGLSSGGGDDGDNNGISQTTTSVYLHVGPSGDCWTGHSIFAAKHLQPDYVKSVKLPDDTNIETLLEILEEEDAMAKDIYDSGSIPPELLQQAHQKSAEEENDDTE